MLVLVRYLTGDIRAALVSAAIFTLAPYRIEHFIHLELQWTVWMPLTLWAVHRTFDEGTVKAGLLTGLFLSLQTLSCVYYGAYLSIIVGALSLLLMASRPEQARTAIRPLCYGALLASGADRPLCDPYWRTRELGPRPPADRQLQRRVGQLSRRSAELAVGMDGLDLQRQRASVSRLVG